MGQVATLRQTRREILIALGSNANSVWGDVGATVLKSRGLISQRIGKVTASSRFYQTPAFPAGAGPDFVNAVIAVQTQLLAGEILAHLHDIEQQAGRERVLRWGQRTLDLDLIADGDVVLPDRQGFLTWCNLPVDQQALRAPDQLILPHPRVQDRSFVLVPLADVAPDWVHPVSGITVRDMLAARPAAERDSVVALSS